METRSERFFRSLGERVAGWERGLYRGSAAARQRLGAMRAASAKRAGMAAQRARIFRDQTSAAALRGLSVLGRNVAKAQSNMRTTVSTAALASSSAVGRVDRRIVTAASITGVMLVSVAAFALTSPAPDRDDRGQNRRAFDTRAAELATLALRSDSHFFCLEAPQVAAMESFCEQALFGSPAQVSAALSYVTARLGLLADGTRYARRHEPEFEPALAALRRSLEHDRYGLLAHVLASRDGCTAEQCEAFALLRDSKQVRANMQARAFEAHVARSAVAWQGGKAPAFADKGAGGAEVALRDRAITSDAQVAAAGDAGEKKDAAPARPAEEADTALHELETPIRVASLDLAGNIVNDAGGAKPELRQAVALEKPTVEQAAGGNSDVAAVKNEAAPQKNEAQVQKEAALSPKVEQPREATKDAPAKDAAKADVPKGDAQKNETQKPVEAAKLAEPVKDAAPAKDAPQQKEAALKPEPKQAEQSFQLEDVPPKLGGSAPIVGYRSLGDGSAGLRQQTPKPDAKPDPKQAKADPKQDGAKADPKKDAKADPKARTASRELKFPTADSIPAIDIMRAEPNAQPEGRKPANNREAARQNAPKEPAGADAGAKEAKAANAPKEQAGAQPQRQSAAKQRDAAAKDPEGAPKEAESKPTKKSAKAAAAERRRLQKEKEKEAQAAAERERIEAAPRNPLSALFQ